MKKRFSEEQIIKILREGESESSIKDICRKRGITEQTFYRWRRKYGNMEVNDIKRLRDLEKENLRLKRILAERDLEVDVMKELLSKNF